MVRLIRQFLYPYWEGRYCDTCHKVTTWEVVRCFPYITHMQRVECADCGFIYYRREKKKGKP